MDTPLKQRLIGAIVLVALAVIFLPMLVKGPAPDSGVRDVPLTAPAAPADGQFQTRELPLVTPAAGGALGMPAAPLAQDNPDAADLADSGNTQAFPPAVAAGNYAVNFGAYASEADADAVIAHLKKSQLPGFRQADTINGRQAWRVRIGPYADRAEAELVRLQATKVRSDVNAQVVVLDANAAAPAPSAPVAAASASPPVRTETLPPQPATPVAAAPAPASKPVPALEPEPKRAAAKTEPLRPEVAKPVVTAPTRPPVVAPSAPAASSVGYAVQLGAFGQAADANALRDKVRAAGFSAFVEQVQTDKGPLNRVRVGPVASREAAEQLKAQVAAKVGVAGMVRPHP
ncbi:SPOR domain-containing protein [Stenotrophomonas sp. YIM B06876]|uniref:SPOR domain-containing protein n=1 Tax=Stenotrophomonas sp. YIM B06876 TaxID=3060211 RepID=UPI00273873C6|nr:SPOR domain-containing protein [Stenotrophomonas sp. YIM B06876]